MMNTKNSTLAYTILICLIALSGMARVGHSAIVAPTDIAGHVLWLDGNDLDGNNIADSGASGTPFTTWVDKSSGAGINTVTVPAGVTTNPTVQFNVQNSHSVARFVGATDSKLDNAAFSLNTPYTIYTVVKSTTLVGSGHILSGIDQPATDEVLYRAGNSPRFYDGAAIDQGITGTFTTTNFHLFGIQVNPGGASLGFFDNNAPSSHTWTASAALAGLRIGNLSRNPAPDTAVAESWAGDIAEVIMYNRVLTDGSVNAANNERTDVYNYLNQKWGLGLPPQQAPPPPPQQPVLKLDASTLNLANGQTVTTWGPAAGSGTPTFQTNQTPNGKPAVQLNGTDNFGQLAAANVPISASGDFILAAVIKPNSINAYHNLIDGDGGQRPMMWIDGGNRYEWNFAGGTSPLVGSGTGGWDILIADSKNNLLYVNSATPNGSGSSTVLYNLAQDFDLFNRNGGATFQGSVAEMRLYTAATDIPALYNELYGKWIVPEPSTFALGGVALAGLLICKRKRRR